MKRLIAILFSVAVSIGVSAAATPPKNFAKQARALIEPKVKANEFSGAVLVAQDGKVIYREAFGYANREWNIPNTPETKFAIASVTKQFTGAAIMTLVEQGKVKLDDPVSKYYPAAPAAWKGITVKHLLVHSSGLPNYSQEIGPGQSALAQKVPQRDWTLEELLAYGKDRNLDFEPGAGYKYSNTGYWLLGYIIEKASGESYADYLRKHLFEPAGMTNSGHDSNREIIPGRAAGYAWTGDRWVNAAYISATIPSSAGSVYSTVDDMLRWEQAINNATVLSRDSLKQIFTDYGNGYGFGWGFSKKFGREAISHAGGRPGYSSVYFRYPADKLAIIILTNIEVAPRLGGVVDGLAGLYFGMPVPPPAAQGQGGPSNQTPQQGQAPAQAQGR